MINPGAGHAGVDSNFLLSISYGCLIGRLAGNKSSIKSVSLLVMTT